MRLIWGTSLAILAIGTAMGLTYLHMANLRHRAKQAQADERRHAREAAEKISKLESQLKAQSELTEYVISKISWGTVMNYRGEHHDPVPSARGNAARLRGLTVDELNQRLAMEEKGNRGLLATIQQGRAAASQRTADWQSLEAHAFIQLGETEYATGHYQESIAPCRQGLNLLDEQKENGAWCNAARQLDCSLERVGLYKERQNRWSGKSWRSARRCGDPGDS